MWHRAAAFSLWAGLALVICGLVPNVGSAALQRYRMWNTQILHSGTASPSVQFFPPQGPPMKAVIDDSVSPPVMMLLDIVTDGSATVDLPQLSGFVYASRKFTQGPAPVQTGVSGSSASQIDWGTLTGWKVSGRNWCNSEPATTCLIIGDTDEETGPTKPVSPFYDIGTWFFHGTGFTSVPFVYSRLTTGAPGDNRVYRLFGGLDPNGSVPALSLAALALVGTGVLAAAAASLRQRTRDGGR